MRKDPTKKPSLSNEDVVRNRKKSATAKDGLHKLFGKLTFYGGGFGTGKIKMMSNADRRSMGLEQDKELPDYQEEKNEKPAKNSKDVSSTRKDLEQTP
jgi:hypothetical protein